jgi:hypothetical protein
LFLGGAAKACNAALSSHVKASAIVLLQHRPYGSVKLSTPSPVSDIDQPQIASMCLGTVRAKAGETRGLSADNLIGGSP